jgi:hypothetical protein
MIIEIQENSQKINFFMNFLFDVFQEESQKKHELFR